MKLMAKHAPPETRRSEILDAAMACFADHGYHETSIDDIAAHSGLSKGAIYHHFDSKREILASLFEAWADQLIERWEVISHDSDPLEALSRSAQAAFTVADQAQPLVRASLELLAHAAREEDMRLRLAGVYSAARDHCSALLLNAQEQGLIHEVQAESVASALIAMFEGLFILKIMDPDRVDVSAAWEQGVSALLGGLARNDKNGDGS
jgi:AcrR family transcriptional regulator